jgi:hypothetical protein
MIRNSKTSVVQKVKWNHLSSDLPLYPLTYSPSLLFGQTQALAYLFNINSKAIT